MNFSGRKKPKQADAKQVFDYACWLLARRNYSQKELLEKFHTRFIPAEEIFSAALEKLEKFGFQSDEGFTESFIRSHPDWGKRRINLELKRKGIGEDLIEKFSLSEEDELTRCQETLTKKLKGEQLPEEYKEKQKLASFLARRGFDLDVIREILKF